MKSTSLYAFRRGLLGGLPIALGYLSVSFGFGITAAREGLGILASILISFTNLTSAGQVAGLAIITAGGTLWEMAATQFVINIRYFLMSLSLSQRLAPGFSLGHRALAAFGITDEIFGVASSEREEITPLYMYGLILLPLLGWTLGTMLGAVAGSLLPESIKNALGIAIYGMFVAIVVPPAKREKGVLLGVGIAVGIRCLIAYLPLLNIVSPGFAIIIAAVAAAAIAAALFPIRDREEESL